jgi:2-polyprenyl-6-methoxyphenol hydroxylase-like FAD-dependent oxidoreductase
MSHRSFDLAVLGGGPAGIMAALSAARDGDVALVVKHVPRADDPVRVDAVPAGVVALLMELGISPRSIGADRIHRRRWVAWSTRTPQIRESARTVHLLRPMLECALMQHALREPRIALFVSTTWRRTGTCFHGDGWDAPRLVDATGRTAATAQTIVRPSSPWAARTFWLPRPRPPVEATFAIVPLPEGYAYRMGASPCMTLGFVGQGSAVRGSAADLCERLRSVGARWMVDDLPPLDEFREGPPSTASVQWSAPAERPESAALRIGDAALARDPLSSHGIAGGCSEGLMIAALRTEHDVALFERRQRQEWASHMRSLRDMSATCLFASTPAWRDYAEFVRVNGEEVPAASAVALRGGAIVEAAPTEGTRPA